MIYYKYFYFSNWVVNICKLKKIEIYEVSFFYELSAVSWRNVSWLLQIWKKNHLRFVRLLPSWIEEILDDKFSFTNIAFKWLLLSWTFFEKKITWELSGFFPLWIEEIVVLIINFLSQILSQLMLKNMGSSRL